MEAVVKHKVKRLVVTSSTTCVFDRVNNKTQPIVSEKDWADEKNTVNAYTKAKILQEKLVWDSWRALAE